MRIALINGSPKIQGSASKKLSERLKCICERRLEQIEIAEFGFHDTVIAKEVLEDLSRADIWVFLFPLYVDGIPSHLLSCLIQLEETDFSKKHIHAYGIVNCGFYEGVQAEFALKILQNWSVKAGCIWGSGVGVGGGGALSQMPQIELGHGPMAPIDKAFAALLEEISKKEVRENRYVSIAFPRFLYKLSGQLGWRKMIKANGKKVRELGNRPESR